MKGDARGSKAKRDSRVTLLSNLQHLHLVTSGPGKGTDLGVPDLYVSVHTVGFLLPGASHLNVYLCLRSWNMI